LNVENSSNDNISEAISNGEWKVGIDFNTNNETLEKKKDENDFIFVKEKQHHKQHNNDSSPHKNVNTKKINEDNNKTIEDKDFHSKLSRCNIFILQFIASTFYFLLNSFKASSSLHQTRNYDQSYDPLLGVVLNVDNLEQDTGDNKYKRRPLFEWFNRWLK
jgi:ATP-dependent Zn protease